MAERVWLITGAGRGLGRAFAQEAVKHGDRVIAGVRKIPEGDDLFKNERVLPVRMDVTDASSAMRPRDPMPEYDGTPAHDTVKYIDENNHLQSGDPAKAAEAVYRIAVSDRMPRRLALGSACVAGYREFLQSQLDELASYEEMAAATDF